MNNVVFVRVIERGRSLFDNFYRARKGKRLVFVEQRLQAAAFDQFHRDIKNPAFFAGVIDDNNIWISENSGSARFSLETRQKFGTICAASVSGKMHCFYGVVASDHRIVRAINIANSSARQFVWKLA